MKYKCTQRRHTWWSCCWAIRKPMNSEGMPDDGDLRGLLGASDDFDSDA
jgi:hypothetical protein